MNLCKDMIKRDGKILLTTFTLLIASLSPVWGEPHEKIVALLNKYRSTGFSASDPESFAYNITTWQMPHGGFSKGIDYSSPWDGTEALSEWSSDGSALGMYDNNATVAEARFVADTYKKTTNTDRKTAFKRCVNMVVGFVLKSQYPSGGWPQVYPKRNVSYSNHVTFNDNAMVRVMVMISDMIAKRSPFDTDIIDTENIPKLQTALEKGVEYCLKAQIINDDKPTIWCAQHDPVNFQPRGARSYELPSKSGSESVGITAFLMNWSDQTEDVQNAVNGAITWYLQNEVNDLRFSNGSFAASAGSSLWYRFYNVENDQHFFSGRDGVKKYDISQIEEERRTGYQWAGDYGSALLSAAVFYNSTSIGNKEISIDRCFSITIEKMQLHVKIPAHSSGDIILVNGIGKVMFKGIISSNGSYEKFDLNNSKISKGNYFAIVRLNGRTIIRESVLFL